MLLQSPNGVRELIAEIFDVMFIARKTVDVLRADGH